MSFEGMIERLGAFAIGVVLACSCTSSGDTADVDGATDPSATKTAAPPSPISWPANAVVFARARSDDLAATTTLRAVSGGGGRAVKMDVPLRTSYLGQAAWSRDGSQIAFIAGPARHVHAYAGDGFLYVMDADGSGLTRLTAQPVVSSPSWAPDGRRLVVVRHQGQELVVMNDTGRHVDVIARRDGFYQWPAWSPDGSLIAFQSMPLRPDGSVTEAVYVIRPSGRGATRLTSATTSEGFPAWSPDGSRIAYSAGLRLWVMNADGSDVTQLARCIKPCGADYAPTWSPRGRWIAFLRESADGATRLFRVGVRSGRIRELTHARGGRVSYPTWRP